MFFDNYRQMQNEHEQFKQRVENDINSTNSKHRDMIKQNRELENRVKNRISMQSK